MLKQEMAAIEFECSQSDATATSTLRFVMSVADLGCASQMVAHRGEAYIRSDACYST